MKLDLPDPEGPAGTILILMSAIVGIKQAVNLFQKRLFISICMPSLIETELIHLSKTDCFRSTVERKLKMDLVAADFLTLTDEEYLGRLYNNHFMIDSPDLMRELQEQISTIGKDELKLMKIEVITKPDGWIIFAFSRVISVLCRLNFYSLADLAVDIGMLGEDLWRLRSLSFGRKLEKLHLLKVFGTKETYSDHSAGSPCLTQVFLNCKTVEIDCEGYFVVWYMLRRIVQERGLLGVKIETDSESSLEAKAFYAVGFCRSVTEVEAGDFNCELFTKIIESGK